MRTSSAFAILMVAGCGVPIEVASQAVSAAHGDSNDECPYRAGGPTFYQLDGRTFQLLALRNNRMTAACNNTAAWQAVVFADDNDEDHVIMCCGDGETGSYAEKTCPLQGICTAGARAGLVCREKAECPGSACKFKSACGESENRCQACLSKLTPYEDHCALGIAELEHAGQQPHVARGNAERTSFACRSYGNQCLANGVDGDCFGEGGSGEGAAPECCSGRCCHYHCCG